ncbi:MAG: LysR family transcriptional regulator [Eubacterium sp.]|nr:LysR family transcriptional regulator [Eubacterium sp.]
MTLQQLQYLVTVAEYGNISAAAEQLYISQPSLSAAIHNLEEEMGVTAFVRSNKGVVATREGEDLLAFARSLLEQAEIMRDHFVRKEDGNPKFSVSCQHYAFAVNAFVDLVENYDARQYSFILRETQTGEIIEDVSQGKSEIGVIYLADQNQDVLQKMIKKNDLIFEELYRARPHVFISRDHPLASKDKVLVEDLKPYPYLVFEQGERNSFYFAEEFLSLLDFPKTIQVRDRATLFNLVIGLKGFTVSSGVLDQNLNGSDIIARPLDVDIEMRIGYLKKKNTMLSRYGQTYIEALRQHLSQGDS